MPPKPPEDLALLRRLAKVKGARHTTPQGFGDDMLAFFKQGIQRRQPRLEAVARAWQTLVPQLFLPHTCLEAFSKGTLTVLVDSQSHLYELKQLLLSGLEKQLLVACKPAGLRKVSLKRGQWYDPQTGAPKF